MIKKVTFLVNYNLYESKRYFTHMLADAMNRHGIKTHIIDVEERSLEAEDVIEIQEDQPDLTCSFNALNPLPSGKYFWDIIKIPHLSILVDPAFYSAALMNSPYSIISCVDQFDCDALTAGKFQNGFFWPHAIESNLEIGKGDRPYEAVFIGSCYDYESLRKYWLETQSSEVCSVLDNAIDIVLSKQMTSLADALVTAWNNSKLEIGSVDFFELFYFLDNYTRGKDRAELIKSIKDANVHVFGELVNDHPACQLDWSYYLGNQSNVTLHPSVSFPESFNILQKSKICLNSMPFFKNGSHERIFTGLATGAFPITSHSLFWEKNFQIGKDLLTYFPGQWSTINEQVSSLLSNESQRKKMVESGRKKVMESHTWDARVKQFLNAVPPILQRIKMQ